MCNQSNSLLQAFAPTHCSNPFPVAAPRQELLKDEDKTKTWLYPATAGLQTHRSWRPVHFSAVAQASAFGEEVYKEGFDKNHVQVTVVLLAVLKGLIFCWGLLGGKCFLSPFNFLTVVPRMANRRRNYSSHKCLLFKFCTSTTALAILQKNRT